MPIRHAGPHVSAQFDDQVVMRSRPTVDRVCHVTTIRETDERRGQVVETLSFALCEVRRPHPVCPCGQLFVEWVSKPRDAPHCGDHS